MHQLTGAKCKIFNFFTKEISNDSLIPIRLNYETDVNPEREVSLSFLIALASRGVSPLRIGISHVFTL
ncbi:hypothetical protein CK516_01810 [Nostoc sp. 'Peltigera malacea cyanobiont' DB3992]|nr:hypothetical protein CK516_01810 [Nostoc sp. 'Peltigera malacea cyanobiont' DB3992]